MLEWGHTEDCYLMQWQKPSPLLSEFTALCGMIYPEKTAEISPHHHWFPCEMTSKQASANPILMTCHYPNVGTAFDWLKQISLAARQIRSTTHIWVATRHHYRVCARSFDAI